MPRLLDLPVSAELPDRRGLYWNRPVILLLMNYLKNIFAFL
jgi:hypothetical protein